MRVFRPETEPLGFALFRIVGFFRALLFLFAKLAWVFTSYNPQGILPGESWHNGWECSVCREVFRTSNGF